MTIIFLDMIHREIELYVDDVIIKSKENSEHTTHLRVPAEKLLEFIVSRRGIELDQTKIKEIQELPPPKTKKEFTSFLERVNYIERFIAQSTIIVEPILKLLKKDAQTKWTKECQEAFDTINRYLSNPPVLVPPRPRSPLLLYLSVAENAFDCVLGKHNEEGKRERAIYYLSKKFTASQKAVKGQALADLLAESPVDEKVEPLRTHFPDEGIFAIKKEATKPYTGWKLFFDRAFNYKGFGIRAVLILENGQHYPMAVKLKFCRTNNTAEHEACIPNLRMALDMDIDELLVVGDSDLLIHQVQGEWATKNEKILPYINLAQRLCKKFKKIEFQHTPRAQNEFADALATIALMIQHPESSHIGPLKIRLKEEHAHCCHVEGESDGKPCYSDVKVYLERREYPEGITNGQKKTVNRMANGFSLNKEVPYKRTLDLGLLRCVNAGEAIKLLDEVHAGMC
ncbi:uncharacterized protein LOC132613010 [Lycium barbarum]|uniref:uncharacterized protein LOC132613010 n=1 Tax=Lycium barbarum TaxID=112863 RepID=UPI00293EA35B|nr:uncharacterized protein LOC132613010 [Lycium barbarum]